MFGARTRVDRRIAALRCVGGSAFTPPTTANYRRPWTTSKTYPLPLDPVNGKPFSYRRAWRSRFFSCEPFPDQPANNANTPTYELSVK